MRTFIESAVTVLATSTLLAACGDASPAAVTVGPVSFSENELLGLSHDRRRNLAELTAFALSVADSTADQLGAPLVAEWTEGRLLEVLAAELTLEKNGVGDGVLEAHYLPDPQWELTVRHVLFFSERWRSPAHRAEAAAKAARAMESLKEGADFGTTAAELSEEPGAEGRQGLLQPGREGSWVPEFWTAALALQPGEISPVTETQYGYHILRLDDRQVVPFREARSVVARDVADKIEDPDAVLREWMDAAASDGVAARAAGLAEASRRDLSVPATEQAKLLRLWEDQVYQWSTTLGFRYGLTSSEVAAAALAALSSPAQGANLARTALSEYTELLSARYPFGFAGS